MKEIEILVIGKHREIMGTILRLINSKPEWNGSTAFSISEAIEKSNIIQFNIVLLGAGLSAEEKEQVKSIFNIPVIQHYGGGSGLLYAEIYQGLQ
jgi:hypothetical protein